MGGYSERERRALCVSCLLACLLACVHATSCRNEPVTRCNDSLLAMTPPSGPSPRPTPLLLPPAVLLDHSRDKVQESLSSEPNIGRGRRMEDALIDSFRRSLAKIKSDHLRFLRGRSPDPFSPPGGADSRSTSPVPPPALLASSSRQASFVRLGRQESSVSMLSTATGFTAGTNASATPLRGGSPVAASEARLGSFRSAVEKYRREVSRSPRSSSPISFHGAAGSATTAGQQTALGNGAGQSNKEHVDAIFAIASMAGHSDESMLLRRQVMQMHSTIEEVRDRLARLEGNVARLSVARGLPQSPRKGILRQSRAAYGSMQSITNASGKSTGADKILPGRTAVEKQLSFIDDQNKKNQQLPEGQSQFGRPQITGDSGKAASASPSGRLSFSQLVS